MHGMYDFSWSEPSRIARLTSCCSPLGTVHSHHRTLLKMYRELCGVGPVHLPLLLPVCHVFSTHTCLAQLLSFTWLVPPRGWKLNRPPHSIFFYLPLWPRCATYVLSPSCVLTTPSLLSINTYFGESAMYKVLC